MEIRVAKKEDLKEIVSLLADDTTGSTVETPSDPLPPCYLEAYDRIEASSCTQLIVASDNNEIVGCMQLTIIPHLSFQGSSRALVESVRVKANRRHQNLCKQMFEWAIDRARDKGCHLVQLTTNKSRRNSIRFYQSIGFESTHEGVKLYLKDWDSF